MIIDLILNLLDRESRHKVRAHRAERREHRRERRAQRRLMRRWLRSNQQGDPR